jgi:hypothetical protein
MLLLIILNPEPCNANAKSKALAGRALREMGARYSWNSLLQGLTPEGPPYPGIYIVLGVVGWEDPPRRWASPFTPTPKLHD